MTTLTCPICAEKFLVGAPGKSGRHPKFCPPCRAAKSPVKKYYYEKNREKIAVGYEKMRPLRVCDYCGKNPVAKYKTRYCSDVCAHEAAITSVKDAARSHKNGERVYPLKVFERDKWTCYICQGPVDPLKRGTNFPDAPEIDHVVSIRNGGKHTYDNVKTAHRSCNAMKSAMDFRELVALAHRIAKAHPAF
jgi:5-methylcytosine-specific restriction endonuclease McrA